jgi:erythromycin esterase-like protein
VLENLLAWLDTENMPIPQRIQARDRLMAGNARRVIGPGSGGKRVVMWLHNGHAARSTAALGDYRGADNLGASLARQYGNRLYSLAMTAHGGEYRWSPGTNKPLPASPGGSLESRFGSEDKSVFVSKARLKQTANCAAGVFGHSFVEARWHDAFDGIVVLNAEHPPHSTRP